MLKRLLYSCKSNLQNDNWAYFPQLIIAILSPRRSASSMKCVVRMIVLSDLYLINRSQIALLEYGSTPAVGSSRTTTLQKCFDYKMKIALAPYLDPPTKAQAMLSFLCIPPERFLLHSSLLWGIPKSLIIWSFSCIMSCLVMLFNPFSWE